jgi:uncharacterized protein DUF6535
MIREGEVGRSEMHEMATPQPHESTIASVALPVFTSQDVDKSEQSEAQEVTSTASCSMRSGSNIDSPQRSGSVSDTRAGLRPGARVYFPHNCRELNDLMDANSAPANNSTAESAPRHSASHADRKQKPKELGDFDGSAGDFWTLFKKEAKSHDNARIYVLKEDMGSALIFVRSYSVRAYGLGHADVWPQAGLFAGTLTGFVLNSKQDLKVNPADETVYYLRQHSTILSQISVQLASIAPQVSIPSTPPAPFPLRSPSAFNVRVNVFWFMALVFSLLAALLAILVQKWVRDYMKVFDRFSDPLKTARLRQYLYKGCKRLPMVAEIVPGCLHVSLFLFFVRLGNSLFNINTTVGISTIVPIGICGLLYVWASFLPIISPQSSYQTSFSGIFWILLRNLRFRKYRDQGPDGESKPVDASMAQGRMELAMKETEARKGRDAEAIRWLIVNMTEDAEMEKLLSAIPGSFNTGWGIEVWNEVGKCKQDESDDRSQDEPAHAAGPPVIDLTFGGFTASLG